MASIGAQVKVGQDGHIEFSFFHCVRGFSKYANACYSGITGWLTDGEINMTGMLSVKIVTVKYNLLTD